MIRNLLTLFIIGVMSFTSVCAQEKPEADSAKLIEGLLSSLKTPGDYKGDYYLFVYGRVGADGDWMQKDQQKQAKQFNPLSQEAFDRKIIGIYYSGSDFKTLGGGTAIVRRDSDSVELALVTFKDYDQLLPTGKKYEAILVGKDGEEKMRWKKYVNEDEVFKVIDELEAQQDKTSSAE